MGLSKKPNPEVGNKGVKPSKVERIKAVLKPKKPIGVSVKTPSLMGTGKTTPLSQISISGGKPRIEEKYKTLPTVRVEAGDYGLKQKAETAIAADINFGKTIDNTISSMAENMGIEKPEAGSSFYNTMKGDILKNRKDLVTTKDKDGNNIFGLGQSWRESFISGLGDYAYYGKKGFDYFFSKDDANKIKLKSFTPSTSLAPVPKELPYMAGQFSQPFAAGITGAIGGAAAAGPYGALGGALVGAGTTFALSAPQGVGMRYAESLESNYFKGVNQGLSADEAYKAAKSTALVAAGGEAAMQAAFATIGAPGTSYKSVIFKDGAAKGFLNTASKYINKTVDFTKTAAFLGTEGAMVKGLEQVEAMKQGIDVKDPIMESVKYGGDFAVMDLALRSVLGIAGATPKFIKAQALNALNSADRNIVKEAVKRGEESGAYPEGSSKTVNSELSSFKRASDSSPKYPGDAEREGVVIGLTQKLKKLKEQQNKLDDIHKADLQPEIDDIINRIETAKKSDNPLEAEKLEDGSPLVEPKKQEYATTTSEGVVQEGGTEGGISQYQGAEEVKAPEAIKAGDSNRPVSGKAEEVVQPTETVKFSDKIRKLKIDESILTGGDKGVAQSNIAGLPIGIYNASIEAIALSVEAGEKIAVAIENQIKSLKEGGRAFNEERFRKNVMLLEKVNTDKARIAAESEMAGIKSADYAELQRFALEKYNESEVFRDPEALGKRLREELGKKMDTSNISDDVFEIVAYDAIANEKQAPFMPGTKTKVELPYRSYSLDEIVTNPREIFKAMYTAAKTQAKSAKERLKIASDDIADAIYKKKNIRINPNAVSRAIRMFVNDSMDTETASIAFADNMAEIMRRAENSVKYAEINNLIGRIRAASKSKSYGTVATRNTTKGIEFISPSKISDDASLKKYGELLEDYRKSVSGEISDTKTARGAIQDFIYEQKSLYEDAQRIKQEAKRAQYEAKYDKLLAENKIAVDENTKRPSVTKDEFVDALMNPNKEKTPEVENAVLEAEIEEAPTLSQQSKQRQGVLKEVIDEGGVDVDFVDDAKAIADIDTELISPANLKLFNNILEDIINGEEPSRHGQILADVAVNAAKKDLPTSGVEIRPVTKLEKAGVFNFLKTKVFGVKPSGKVYETIGITNLLRQLTKIDKYTTRLREMTIGEFEKEMKNVNTDAQIFLDGFIDIFSGKTALIDGKRVGFTAKRLTENNSYRLGIVSALEQVSDFNLSLENVIESVKAISKIYKDDGIHGDYLNNTKQALKELGIVDGYVEDAYGQITSVSIAPDVSMQKILSNLNDREVAILKYSKDNFSKISNDVRKAAMSYYGVDLDISSQNYLPRVPFFTGQKFQVKFDEPVFADLPEHVRKLRASSTFERTANLNLNAADGSVIHYDFDFYKNIPNKFHESLTTAKTSGSTAKISKLINSKEFSNFISGKFNIEPKQFETNKKVFIDHISEYVNMERKPYVVAKELGIQRNRFMKFAFGKLLNTWDAAIKQYVPGTVTLMTEAGGVPFLKANEIFYKSFMSNYSKDLLFKFLSNTSQANRVTGAIEALHNSSKSIDNSSFVRGFKDVADFFNKTPIVSKSLELGDKAVTVQALLIGYMKGLKLTGKLKNYSDFNLESELSNGLDQYALSYAENFLSFANNESTASAKAKVFRGEYAGTLRMLMSFNHNQTTNFLIDVGRLADNIAEKGSIDERNESIKRIFQYFSNQALFATTAWGLGTLNYKMAKALGSYVLGTEYGADDEAEKANNDKMAISYYTGAAVDAFLGRQNLLVAQGAKAGIKFGIDKVLESNRKEMEKMGLDPSKTIYSKGYSPIYKNDYLGVSGTIIQDLERYATSGYQAITGDDKLGQELVPSQRKTLKYASWLELASLAFPFRDAERLSSNIEKSIKNRPLKQLDFDAYMLSVARNDGGDYDEKEIQQAEDYIKSKNQDYISLKVSPHADKLIDGEIIKASASSFGNQFSTVVSNIVTGKVRDISLVLNNRYPNSYLQGVTIPVEKLQLSNSIYNPQISFMLQNGVISARDYAFSFAYDKNGDFRTDMSEEEMDREIISRYAEAMAFPKVAQAMKGANVQYTPEEIRNEFRKFNAERYIKTESKK